MKITVEFDLNDPSDREKHELARDGWRYKERLDEIADSCKEFLAQKNHDVPVPTIEFIESVFYTALADSDPEGYSE